MIELRTPAQIEEMRPAGRFVADVLLALQDEAGRRRQPARAR